LVRCISLFTAVIVAHLTNLIFSAPKPAMLIKARSFFAEQQVWATHVLDADPASDEVQLGYKRVVELIAMEDDFKAIMSAWCFSKKTKDEVNYLMARHKAIYEYMAFRSFLHVYLRYETAKDELESARQLLELSVRSPKGTSAKGLTFEEEIAQVEALPERMRPFKNVFKSILSKLNDCKDPPYRMFEDKPIYPFVGLI
jgi:hypothetical protein